MDTCPCCPYDLILANPGSSAALEGSVGNPAVYECVQCRIEGTEDAIRDLMKHRAVTGVKCDHVLPPQSDE